MKDKITPSYLAFQEYQKNRQLPLKYQTPDNYWSDWFVKGYQAAKKENDKQLKIVNNKALEVINDVICSQCFKGKYCEDPCELRDEYIIKFTKL